VDKSVAGYIGSDAEPSENSPVLRIVIRPTRTGRKWIARLGHRVLCVAAAPFVKSARVLLAEDYPADTMIEMWRPNTAEWALRGRLGAVAATVIDGEKPPHSAKNGSPVRDLAQDSTPPSTLNASGHARPVFGLRDDFQERD
jgi:hypothetical protein